MPVAKEQIRQIIADNNISSVADVYYINHKITHSFTLENQN